MRVLARRAAPPHLSPPCGWRACTPRTAGGAQVPTTDAAPPNHAAAFGDAEEGFALPEQESGDPDPFGLGGEPSDEEIPF